MDSKFCKFCGAKIPADAVVCTSCGRQVEALVSTGRSIFEAKNPAPFGRRGQKDKWIAFLLCLFLGVLGIHRFYEGKIITGIIWLCTAGFFGAGIIIDLLILLFKPNPYYA